MTVYVDKLFRYGKYGTWCHMAVGADDDIEELHRMAEQIRLQRDWFQDHTHHPHYDLTPAKRRLAVNRGAVELDSKTFARTCSRYFDNT